MTMSTETTNALNDALSKLGYGLGSPDPGLASSLDGPFVNLMGTEGTSPVALIAVADRPELKADTILQSTAGALSRVEPTLELRPGDPVANLNELVSSVSAPTTMVPILESGAVVGALIWVQDRRDQPAGGPLGAAGSGAAAIAASALSGASHLSRLRDVQLNVTVELGRTAMSVSEVLALEIGSVIELDRAAGAPIDVRVNGTLLARGEVVVVDDEYAIRLTEMIDPERG